MIIIRLLLEAAALALAAIPAVRGIRIDVGTDETSTPGGPIQYFPSTANVSKGSVVTFRFYGVGNNHTVTQSSFSSPCQPLSGGFDSGFIYVPSGVKSGFPVWNLTITDDSKPIWFYCKQLIPAPHCTSGMVGAINAPTSGNNTYSAFLSAAKSSSGNPGQGEGSLAGQGALASAPPGPFPSGATGYSIPTGTSPPSAVSSTAGAASTSTTKTGAAVPLTANGLFVLLAAALGANLASISG